MKNKLFGKMICAIISASLVITLIPQVSFAIDEVDDDASIDFTESVMMEEAEISVDEDESIFESGETDTAEEEVIESVISGVITGFVPLENDSYYFEGEPSEEELAENLPAFLEVYLNGESRITEIPVTWEAVEDFDKTDFYFYSMKPVWGDNFTLSESVDPLKSVPWVTIYKEESDNDDIEPMVDQDELEPLYTEDESLGDMAWNLIDKVTDDSYAASTTTTKVYNYLTKNLGLNKAAACGVMTNIYAESGMSSNNLENTYNIVYGLSDIEYTKRVDAGRGAYKTKYGSSRNFKTDYCGYGLCQWTSLSRRKNLLSRALSAGTSVSNVNTQLAFLNYELKSSYPEVLFTLKHVPNNAAGAYTAAYIFCMAFEIPANTKNTATSRAKTCLSGYWKTYNGSTSTPKSSLAICGYTYPKQIKKGTGMSVKGYVISNKTVSYLKGSIIRVSTGKTVYSKSFSLSDSSCSLYKLDSYMKFSNLSTGSYKYKITVKDKSGYSKTVTHKFSVVSSGSTIKGRAFASVAGSSNPTNNTTTPTSPTTTTTTTPTTETDPTTPTTLPTTPTTSVVSKLAISSYRYPTEIKYGNGFSIWGKVSSNYYLNTVKVGVYTTSGTAKITASKSVKTKNIKTYDVKNFDSLIKFGTLSKGTYYYKVIASDRKDTKTLLNKKFVVY